MRSRPSAIDLQLEFDYSNGQQTPRGYVARNTIEVRVDDLAKVGDVLDAAVGLRRDERSTACAST